MERGGGNNLAEDVISARETDREDCIEAFADLNGDLDR